MASTDPLSTDATYVAETFGIAGATALITGGAKGIGLFVAEGFVRAGVRVYISSRDAEACSAVAERLSAQGVCIAIPADLTRQDEITRLVAELAGRETKLDILVNNAGATASRLIETLSEADWDVVMDLNAKSTFFVTQAFLPLLQAAATAARPARVVNVGSIAGAKTYNNGGFAYMASKAAVNHLTRALAARLVTDHINVNAVAPGPMAGGMMRRTAEDEAFKAQVEGRIPMGRLGDAQDIFGVVAFLCSRASAYMTGVVVPLDGGASTCT